MNLDERINEACGMTLDSEVNQHWREITQPAVKQLIRDVLEYVKPEVKIPLLKFTRHEPVAVDPSYRKGFEDALDSMEAKVKELGL